MSGGVLISEFGSSISDLFIRHCEWSVAIPDVADIEMIFTPARPFCRKACALFCFISSHKKLLQ